jgi:hypothetical protein
MRLTAPLHFGLGTDFEQYGIAIDDVVVHGRSWVFTLDFEAFDPAAIDAWIAAMDRWSDVSADTQWQASVFIALEDVVRLRAMRARDYSRFLKAVARMAAAGATFYPHNHGVFEERTGHLYEHRSQRIAGYPKRASMFFDVVYRHRRDIREWLSNLTFHYDRFLKDAGLPTPSRPAFRAGGWDHGATKTDAKAFVSGLETAGFVWDSSASSGDFGTRTWRIGAPYGRNVFGLTPSLTEAAACCSVDGLGSFLNPRTADAVLRVLLQPRLWWRSPGVFVTVFHFNNLLRSDGYRDDLSVERRIESLFSSLDVFRSALRMSSVSFEKIAISRGPRVGLEPKRSTSTL